MAKPNNRWIRNYEARRHGEVGNGPFTKEIWQSTKYDFASMDPNELQQLYIPSLEMRFGPAVSALRKLWKSYKICGRTGEPRSDICWKINNIQRGLGIEQTSFEEISQYQVETENNESAFSTTEQEEDTSEWSALDKQLRREEEAEEEENDNW
jgi:hypothetical protein